MSGYIGTQPVPQATQTRAAFTCTAGQTSFATGGYTPSFLDVFLNGVHLQNGTDYTAANGSDVVLTAGAALGDVLEVVAYSTFDSANTYTRSEADAEFVNDPDDVITVSGSNVGIGTSTLNSNKAVIEGGSAGTHSSSLKLSTGGSANSLASDLAFYGTFVTPTADKTPRRTADITSGFSTANWGSEYLAFGVGRGGATNDAANLTTECMRIDGYGRVTINTIPSFHARTNYSSPTSVNGVPDYSYVEYNVGSHFSTSTNRFTAPVAGLYHFDVSLFCNVSSSNSGYFWFTLTKNGNIVGPYSHSDNNNIVAYDTMNLSRDLQLAANDYVQVHVLTSAMTVYNTNAYNHFSGFLIG